MTAFNLYGPINNLGYGIVTRGIANSLLDSGNYDFNLSVIGQVQIEDKQEAQRLIETFRNNPWNRKAPSVAIWHEFDLNKFSSDKLVAFPIFETTKFQDISINYLKQMDAVFVLSNWAKEVVEENIGNSTPVLVVPGAANMLETPSVQTMQKNDIFTFCSVGKLEKRKSHVEAIKAYIDVFENIEQDTRFICHCFNPFDSKFVETVSRLLSTLGMSVVANSTIQNCIIATRGNAIVEIPKTQISKEQVFQLYKYSHVGVFPSKAEGWNLPLMECIKSGTPCIATNYSAHTEYLKEEYNYPMELLLEKWAPEVANDGIFFKGDRGDWAAINLDELKEKLLYSYKNYDKIVKNFDNTKIVNTFTWSNTIDKFLQHINSLK